MQIENLISNREWYHQRFDGSPMFIYPVADAELKKEERKPAGTEANVRVCFYFYGKADWYLDMTDVDRGARVIMDLARQDNNISAKLLRAWKKDENIFENFFWKEFPKINLKKLSDQKLILLWHRYYNLFINRLTSSALIDHFALGTDEMIGKLIRKEIKEVKKERKFAEVFSVATAPVFQSFINKAEINLLKIALGISKETPAEYQRRYFWIKNNYVTANILLVKHFQKEIKLWQKSNKDLKEELGKIERTPGRNKLKKQKLFKQYHFSPFLKRLIKISEDFSWWQDERKKATYFNIHIGCKLLTEICKRIGYRLDEMKYAIPPEIESIMQNKKPSSKELQRRRHKSVFIFTRKGYSVKTGDDVANIRKIMFGANAIRKVRILRGLAASLGKTVVGTVKVATSVTDIKKVKLNDILVAVMTRPDYIPAMRKASAIITDEGGITSHAAIVSRELNIPCIIGTKIATKVLKDGDRVEVDADRGMVRVLKK